MAVPIYVPRINNNDDEVKLVEYMVQAGAAVKRGQLIAAVETDKAVVDVESPDDGFFIKGPAECGTMVTVGKALGWVGTTADETPPADLARVDGAGETSAASQPTAKARALLGRHGLSASDVPISPGGTRLTADDVEQHLAQRGVRHSATVPAAAAPAPTEPGALKPLRSDQRGMLATVTWHRDHAVAGYLEIGFDGSAWDAHAAAFQRQHGLLLNPLLPMLAWRLVELARSRPALNATIVGDQRFEYSEVNLGFTVQAGEVLYLAVARNAHALGELGFVRELIELQRRAAAHKLNAEETQGSTIGFSSMARWKVARHVPVLAPMTALMVAHTQDHNGQSVLGATYDHRVLHGADVASLLRSMSQAPKSGDSA